MRSLSTLLGIALFAQSSLQHARPLPPNPDKILTPNSSTPPDPGCKLLASDNGFPDNATWSKELPKAIPKLRGTYGPDYTVVATTIEDVQAAVNFARTHNVRLSVITTGHDFHGRNNARSGLRIDLAAFNEPMVFANGWTCGTSLAPPATVACPVAVPAVEEDCPVVGVIGGTPNKRSAEYQEPAAGLRKPAFKFYQKRDNFACPSPKAKRHCDKKKRHEPGEEEVAAMPMQVPSYNTIKPQANVQAVARVTAGTYHELFYNAADKSGLFVMGAQHGGVGTIGGWAQAGGHNPLAPTYGMQSDQILEYEIVTTDGKFQKVSECSNPELFWALRGGGGGTFGVITAATIKVYPTPPMVVGRFFVNSTSPKLWDAVAYFLQQGSGLRDKYGAQGYFYVYHNAFQSVLHFPNKFATEANAKAAFEPLKKKMEELAGATPQPATYYTYKTYKQWYDAEQGTEEMEDAKVKYLSFWDGSDGSTPGQGQAMENPLSLIPWVIKNSQYPYKHKRSLELRYKEVRKARSMWKRDEMVMLTRPMSRTYLDSRLLSDKHVKSLSVNDLGKLINKTMPGIPNNHIRGFLLGGGKQAQPKVDATALNPAWRTSTYHFIINAVPGDWRHDYDMQALAKQWPDAGAYVNEASPGEPDWKRVFWGSNYARLEQLKKKYDPKNVLWCSPCVGADMFTYDDERLCPNKAYPQAGPAPQTYYNLESKVGISSLPGTEGIPNPLQPIIMDYFVTGKLPTETPEFDSNWNVIPAGQSSSGMDGMDMGGMDMTQGSTPAPSAVAPAPAPASSAPAPAPAPVATAATPAAPAAGLGGLLSGLFGTARPQSTGLPSINLGGLFGGLFGGARPSTAPVASAAPSASSAPATGHTHG